MAALALSRTCALSDFPGCLTVAAWQQQLAEEAWAQWIHMHHVRTRDASLVVNYAEVPFGLCVLDRIEAPVRFLGQAAEILQPAGLLFLTFAYWAAEGDDTASGADERLRIYSAHSYQRLIRDARRLGFENFGGTDWTYHGDLLDDHSLASLVLTKRGDA